ncbi:hypothetical protein [Parvibaculum sp.]|uniref:hypothetical protein n=1 Tax=Parvibaculum sp. TaxID=2024848 RepID=UPI000C920D1E|nr:hypothetical protein [Parvibaculum sp.]MAB12680.1 hypothetical protein [Parvibaculum sp.]
MSEPSSYDFLAHPDIAREVGFLVMYTSSLDAWLIPALTSMLRGKADLAYGILAPVDNLRARLDIVFNVAQANSGKPLPDAMLEQKDALLAAVAMRNSVAHGGFGFTLDGTEMLLAAGITTEKRGKPKTRPIKPEDIRSQVMAIKDFIKSIRVHTGNNLFVGIPANPQAAAAHGRMILSSRHPNEPNQGRATLNFWKPNPPLRK